MPRTRRIASVETPIGTVEVFTGPAPDLPLAGPQPDAIEVDGVIFDGGHADIAIEQEPDIRRRCGYRIAGGIYAVWRSSGHEAWRQSVMDEPHRIDPATMGISPIGVTLIERGGVTHIVDWVGESHYPTVSSFLEEARAMGISRRLARTLPFGRLTERSRILLVHRNACGENQPGIFASFPIHTLEVVLNSSGNTDAVRAAATASIPITPVTA